VLGMENPVAGVSGVRSGTMAQIIPAIAAAEKEKAARAREAQTSGLLSEIFQQARGVPAQTAPLAPGEDAEAAAFSSRTEGRPPMARTDLLGKVLGVPGLSAQQVTLAQDVLKPQAPHAIGEHGLYLPDSGTTIPGPGKPPKTSIYHVNTAQGVIERVADDTGRVISERRIGDLPPHAPQQPTGAATYAAAVDALERAEAKYPPGHPEIVKAQTRVDRLKPMALTEGGFVGGPSGQTTPPPKPPDSAQQTKLAELDAAKTRLTGLLQQAEANRHLLGGVVANPGGTLRRGLSNVVPGVTSPEEKQFLANFGRNVGEERRRLFGAAQTVTELKSAASYLPDTGNVDESTIAALKAAIADVDTSRNALTNVLSQSRRSVPKPAPATGGAVNDADARAAAKYGIR
jgi:hypothetical protein